MAALAQMNVERAAGRCQAFSPVASRKPGCRRRVPGVERGCSVGMAVCTADRYGSPDGAKRSVRQLGGSPAARSAWDLPQRDPKRAAGVPGVEPAARSAWRSAQRIGMDRRTVPAFSPVASRKPSSPIGMRSATAGSETGGRTAPGVEPASFEQTRLPDRHGDLHRGSVWVAGRCQAFSPVTSRKPSCSVGMRSATAGQIGRRSCSGRRSQPSVLRHGLLGSPPSSATSGSSAPSASNGLSTRFVIARATKPVRLKSNAGSAIGPWIR